MDNNFLKNNNYKKEVKLIIPLYSSFPNNTKRKKNSNNLKLKVIFILIIILFLLSIAGVSYSVYRYIQKYNNNSGNKTDMVYSYIESSAAGNGIIINNAFPISDYNGKNLVGQNYTFDFNVTFYPSSLGGLYQIVAVKSDDSNLPIDSVKLYLTTKNTSNGVEREIANCINQNNVVKTYSEYSTITKNNLNGKLLYSEKVTKELINNHVKYFTLRMWIANDKNYDLGINNKKFKVKINFYGVLE